MGEAGAVPACWGAAAPHRLSRTAPAPLERLRVVELRALARAAGLPQLRRSGRRADLLEALVE
ncbi:MAG: SAP domain-containing protein [Vulcanococcus sp.]